jgi:hypothetical protein
VLHLVLDALLPPRLEETLGVEARNAGGDGRHELIGDPAGILGALVLVEPMDDVPEVVVLPGGDRGAERLVRVGADEREAAGADPPAAPALRSRQ